MARKKKAAAAAPVEQTGSIFDHFAAHMPGYAGPPEATPDNAAGKQPDLASVLARIEALETENKTLRDANARASLPMLAAAPAQGAGDVGRVDPARVGVSFDGMPDMVTETAAYQAELNRRINAAFEARDHAIRTEVSTANQGSDHADMLWRRFQTAHPEWAQYESLVGNVATSVVKDLQARGVDTQRYMIGMTDLFIADVAKELNAKYGKLVADGDDEDDEPTATVAKGTGADEDTGRTAGVFGGLESGGNPPSGAGKGAKPAGMLEDLQEIQKKTGFY